MRMKGFLFFDIDGTLVDSEHGQDITPEVREALRQAKQNGWGLFICSGRSLAGLQKYRDIGMDGYIFSDGAGIMIEGEKEEVIPIPQDILSDFIAQVTEEYHGEVFMSGVWKSFASGEQFELMKEYARAAVAVQNISEEELISQFGMHRLEEYDGTPILESDVVFSDEETEKKFAENLHEGLMYISTSASYGRGGNTSGEVTVKGVTKGFGIRRIVEYYGGDMKDTYAFGDSMNDASALKDAAVGVCMGNGAEELKALADHITGDISENGLVHAMGHFGII